MEAPSAAARRARGGHRGREQQPAVAHHEEGDPREANRFRMGATGATCAFSVLIRWQVAWQVVHTIRWQVLLKFNPVATSSLRRIRAMPEILGAAIASLPGPS